MGGQLSSLQFFNLFLKFLCIKMFLMFIFEREKEQREGVEREGDTESEESFRL